MCLDLLLRSVEGQRTEILDAVARDPDPDRAGAYVVVDRHAEGAGQVAGRVEFLGRRKAIFGHADLHHAVQRIELDLRIVGLVGVEVPAPVAELDEKRPKTEIEGLVPREGLIGNDHLPVLAHGIEQFGQVSPGRGNLFGQHAVVQRAGLAQRLPDGKTIEQPVGDVVRIQILAVGNGVTVGAFIADNRDIEQIFDRVAVGVEGPPGQRTAVIERAVLPAGADLGQRDRPVPVDRIGQPDVPFEEIGCHDVCLFLVQR